MATDDQYALLYNKKIISFDQMNAKFLAYLITNFRSYGADTFGTDAALSATAIPVVPSASNNKIDIAKLIVFGAVTGNGRKIKTTAPADSRLQGVKIPPNAGVIYHVGIEQNDVENGIEVNPRTGLFQYLSFLEQLGRVTNPTSVTNNGNGTLTINVNSLVESGDDHSGRQVRVWLKSAENGGPGPKSSSPSIAIQTLSVSFSTPNNTILVPNLFGQSTPSTTATDYVVQLIGPTVKRLATEDLRNTNGCFFMAAVTSVANGNLITTIDTSSQNTIGFGLADVDTHITNLESNLDAFERSVVVSGFANAGNSGLTFPVASGVAVISGLRVLVAAQSLSLTNNTTNFVYVDSADGTTKTATGLGNVPSLWLYKVITAGGAITQITDTRRFATRNNSRAFVTVGSTNSDFNSLEGAIEWVAQHRQAVASAEQTTVEIVVQNNITIARQIALSFPCTIRGANLDGTANGLSSPQTKIITPTGAVAFTQSFSGLVNVTFKDLYFSVPTGSAGSGFFVSAGSGTLGDGWVFDNCVFDGGKDTPMFNFATSGSVYSGWRWNTCVFKNGTHVSAQPYILCSSGTSSPQGFSWRDCRFIGETADLFVQGIQFDQSASEMMVDNCEFNMGGFHILCRNACDQIIIKGSRFKNSRSNALSIATDGEVVVDGGYFTNCMTNGAAPDGVIRSTTISAHGGGIVSIRNNRIKNWATGFAIGLDAGNDHRIEHNNISTNVAAPVIGISMASGLSGISVTNNDIDMSSGASAGAGKASAGCVIQANTTNAFSRITGNKFRNCGTAGGGAAPVVQVGTGNIIASNIFMNCRGTLITTQNTDNIMFGNVDQAGDAGNTTVRVILNGGNNQVIYGNILHTGNAAAKGYDLNTFGSGIRAFGNSVDNAFALFGGAFPTGNAVRKRQSFDPPSQAYSGSSTVVVATVTQPTKSQGVHLPCSVSLPATVGGGTIQAGIRLTFTDGTTQDIINATAGVVTQDLIGNNGLITTTVDDNAIVIVQFVVKNTSTLLVADIGASTYEGYIIC